MKIDIKEITKIKVEPDEMLVINLDDNIPEPHIQQINDRLVALGMTRCIIDHKSYLRDMTIVKQVDRPTGGRWLTEGDTKSTVKPPTNRPKPSAPPAQKAVEEPELKEWEIWVEGYKVYPDDMVARRVSIVSANTFREACQQYFKSSDGYDSKTNTYCDCKLFDNEADARKSFG